MGMPASQATGAMLVCNLLDIEAIAPKLYNKLKNKKAAADNLEDLRSYVSEKYPKR